jgi:hypothetical protein
MNGLRSILLLLSALAISSAGPSTLLAQSVQVRVLDSKSGAPVTNEKVSVLIKGEKTARDYTTDREGNFSLQVDPSAFLYVATEWRITCRPITPGEVPFIPVTTILQEGFTDQNTCGRAKSETVKGKLIIFARKSSLFENFKR